MKHDNRASLVDSISAAFPNCDLDNFDDVELVAVAYAVWNEHGNVYEHETAEGYLRDYVSDLYHVTEQDLKAWAWDVVDDNGGIPEWLRQAAYADDIVNSIAEYADRIGAVTEVYVYGMGTFTVEDYNV